MRCDGCHGVSTARRASFALYFEDVDTGNHRAGPGIARPGMTNDVNVIVVSDHGTAPIARERTVFLDDYVSMDSLELTDTSPVATSVPKPGREAYVYRRLKDANPHLAIYGRPMCRRGWMVRLIPSARCFGARRSGGRAGF